MLVPNSYRIPIFLGLLVMANAVTISQTAPTASATPAAATGSTASAVTACPAAFGIFGSAGAAGGSSSTPSTPPVMVTQTVGNTAKPAATKPAATGNKQPSSGMLKPITGVVQVDPSAHLNAIDLASALSGKIPSVTALVPIGSQAIFYTIDPTKFTAAAAGSGTPDPSKAATEVEAQLRALIGGAPTAPRTGAPAAARAGAPAPPSTLPQMPGPHLKVLALPQGYGHACDIITAIGHQEPGVLSLGVIDDSRILAGLSYDPNEAPALGALPSTPPSGSQRFADLKQLVDDLAVPSTASAARVEIQAVRLYYERDPRHSRTLVASGLGERIPA